MILLALAACTELLALLSNDTVIDASCLGTDTVVVDGRDLCAEYETTGRVRCDVGYVVVLDGKTVCP